MGDNFRNYILKQLKIKETILGKIKGFIETFIDGVDQANWFMGSVHLMSFNDKL